MAQHRVDVSVTIPLPEPVKVEVSSNTREDTALQVEWEVSITANSFFVVGRARGNYNVVSNFRLESAPEWAPQPPASLISMATTLFAEAQRA